VRELVYWRKTTVSGVRKTKEYPMEIVLCRVSEFL